MLLHRRNIAPQIHAHLSATAPKELLSCAMFGKDAQACNRPPKP